MRCGVPSRVRWWGACARCVSFGGEREGTGTSRAEIGWRGEESGGAASLLHFTSRHPFGDAMTRDIMLRSTCSVMDEDAFNGSTISTCERPGGSGQPPHQSPENSSSMPGQKCSIARQVKAMRAMTGTLAGMASERMTPGGCRC